MSNSNKSPKLNIIFDYYDTAVKNCQEILKSLAKNKKYIDTNNGDPIVKSSEGAFMVIHAINRVSMIPATDDKIFFLNGAHINKDGDVVLTSNSHGGVMKRYQNIKRMINTFNKKMTCDGLKIKTMIMPDGLVIQLDQINTSK